MADGGYRPAYNAQLATGCTSQVIVGVAVTSRGTDKGWLGPAITTIEERYGVRPGAPPHRDGDIRTEPRAAAL